MTCSGKPYELAQRFIGTWKEYTVTPEREILMGTLQVSWELGGCVQRQQFLAVDGAFAFLGFGYLDSETQAWQETYVLSTGRVAHYRWREAEAELFIERLGGGPASLRRLRIQNLTPEAYDVLDERSTDGGQTWAVVEVTRTRREA
jgi:hypothetical protein